MQLSQSTLFISIGKVFQERPEGRRGRHETESKKSNESEKSFASKMDGEITAFF